MTSPKQLTLFAAERHAKTSRLPDMAKDWLEREARFGSTTFDLLVNLNRAGWSGKMLPMHYHLTTEETSEQSSWDWMNAGIMSRGECLTLSISEFPSDAEESSLSQVLQMDVPHKYYLSPQACQGILQRAHRRGKILPESLRIALEIQGQTYLRSIPGMFNRVRLAHRTGLRKRLRREETVSIRTRM